MYLPGQIIYDKDKKVPVCLGDDVWDLGAYPKRNTHFIKADDGPRGYSIATPHSVEEATLLLERGLIQPAPSRPDHCWNCGNWKSNCATDTSKFPCSEREESKKWIEAEKAKKEKPTK